MFGQYLRILNQHYVWAIDQQRNYFDVYMLFFGVFLRETSRTAAKR